ncbi:coiled-coil domain-containing protein, partial [Staphylococcus warneri]|uniref:coiled-coil domain-containing protein n=1 Tax=Staphylococcus warneri TaxID=1292 RepID=UPI0038CD10C5
RKHQEVEQFKENTDYYQNQKDRARRLSDHYKKGEEEYKKKVAKLQKQHSILKNEVDMLEQEKLPNLKTQHLNMTNQIKEQKGQLDSTKTELQQAKDEKTKLNNDIESKRDEINNLKAFRDQIRDEKEKEEENYQSLKNVLYEPLNDDIEYEYKKPSLFSKESEKTGRVILKEDDYQILKKQSDFGKRMEPEYKKLINGETIQNLKETTKEQRGTINEQRHKMNVASKNFKKLREERDKYKTAYQEEKQNHENTKGFVKGICETGKHVFGADNYRKVIDKIDDSLKPQYKQRFRNIVVLDHEDRKMFDNKDEKIRNQKAFENTRLNKQNKDKGFDLDL